jgi:hypothetical protein
MHYQGCLLFLVFINDIADGMTDLGRLFTDDTSVGNIANDKYSLKDMANLDLAYFNDWSKRWLVKFNQNKTEMMVFSTRDTKSYLNFDFDGTPLTDVELHKHLGVSFHTVLTDFLILANVTLVNCLLSKASKTI